MLFHRVRHRCLLLAITLLALLAPAATSTAQPLPTDLPDAEKKIADTADPWGSSFSDQLAIHRAYFAGHPDATFAVGYSHALVKIWQNKYWFHTGEVFAAPINNAAAPIWGVTGGTVSFQITILPKVGAATGDYSVHVQSPIPARIYREEFVDVGPAAYPRFETNIWPDPLVESDTCTLDTTRAGVFFIEMEVPPNFKEKTFTCAVRVEHKGGQSIAVSVPVRVVKLTLGASPFPLVANFDKRPIGDAGYHESALMLLRHRMQPLDSGFLMETWEKQGPDGFEKALRELMDRGQTVFYLNPIDPKVYDFLKQKKLLEHFITQVGPDEPDAATFAAKNVPEVKAFHEKFPGVRVLLASLRHPQMEQGCDIQLNDLSTKTYDPRKPRAADPPELWHYYCHLPIQADYRAPLVLAPNMEIDNPALEQRLAMWMSWYYGARGVFIWAANQEITAKDFWKNQPLKIEQDKATFPYGGTHHGNGFLIYPPREPGGVAIPSLRLKMLRDGMEDIAIFEAIKKKLALRGAPDELPAWLSPVPDVFHHPHYFDHLPETLLAKREAILKAFADRDEAK